MNSSRFVKSAGLVGIVAALYGLLAVFAATFMAGDSFSWSENALSDIGVSPAANAAVLFNFSLALVGVLNFVFSVGFVKAYAKDALFYMGSILLVLGGGFLSLVGVFTEAYGNIHRYISLGYFVLFPLAMIMIGIAFTKMNMQNRGYLSILAGIVALLVILGGIALDWHTRLGLGFAVPEIVEALIIAAWIIWMGANLTRLTNKKQ